MKEETKVRLIGKYNGKNLDVAIESKGKEYNESLDIRFEGDAPASGTQIKVLGLVQYDKEDKVSFVKALKWTETNEMSTNEALAEGSVIRAFYSDKGTVSFCSVILQTLNGFQEIKAFRQVADHLRETAKRSCLVKAFGRLANAPFTDKDGNDRVKLTIIVNDESQITVKHQVPDIEAEFAAMTPAYEGADEIPW
jgi:hypothetical protein